MSFMDMRTHGGGRNRKGVSVAGVRGFTLIELMIALALGLLVVVAAGAIFLSNRQTYVATESLGRVQESARVAFELMARDIREAGGNPCNRHLEVANVLTNATTDWWKTWHDGVVGYSPGGGVDMPANWVANTDAIELKSTNAGVTVVSHDPGGAVFVVDSGEHGIAGGGLALACDFGHAAVFQVKTSADGKTISHDADQNCTTALGLPVDCSGSGTEYAFGRNAVVARVNAARWFVGTNGRGGNSLFRSALRADETPDFEEVVEGVADMQIQYLLPDGIDYVPASAVPGTQWNEVKAVRVTIELEGDAANAADGPIERQLSFVAAIRNRNT